MGRRDQGEPDYPRSAEEARIACDRFVEALRAHLGERLVCVLLCGSWARGEARPPESDLDLTVIVDTVDSEAIVALRQAWQQSGAGYALIYGLDEIPTLPRQGREQFTLNAIVLYGNNPFDPPSRDDFARRLVMAAEDMSRCARHVLIYPWMKKERKVELLQGTLKWELRWPLRYLVAYRTGEFPRTEDELRSKLVGMPEEQLLHWRDSLLDTELDRHIEEIAGRLNEFARSWFQEISSAGGGR
jgi:hypothetical protein